MATRFRAPSSHGEILAVPDFSAIPALVERNRQLLDRTDVIVGGLPLRELRALARREVLELAQSLPENALVKGSFSADAPLLLAGHQPELSHPGVWVKNFALNGLARTLGALPVNLIVDTDTLKNAALRFPVFQPGDATSTRIESLAFDTFAGEVPYEESAVSDVQAFRTFADRAALLCANWGYEPLLAKHWQPGTDIGESFAKMRIARERAWGCDNREVAVSRLARTPAFALFAQHILQELARFRDVYNAAIRAYRDANGIRSANHPAPELAEGEAPFWERTANGRKRVRAVTFDLTPRDLRPRAITLTLFARVCLGDFFIHGIGGGKYDEVTDAIIRDFFGLEPPAYQVLSATLHLPLPAFAATQADLLSAQHCVRDLHWNPQKAIEPGTLEMALVRRKRVLIDSEPERGAHAARREWYRALAGVTEQLRRCVKARVAEAETQLARIKSEVAANAILQRRDFAWVLYPEETLRPFLQQFLTLENVGAR